MSAPPYPRRSNTPPITSIQSKFSRKLWDTFKNDAIFSLFSPFVLCLAAANLHLNTFRQYIAQDVHFLKAFAEAFELAEASADDDEAKVSLCQLRKDALDELKLHDSLIQQEWLYEPDADKERPPNSATVKYTDFLLATASGKIEGLKGLVKLATPYEKTKIAAYTMGAMTPCMKLYAFIGKELQALSGSEDSNHPYKKWVDNYSSLVFLASTVHMEELLDKLSASLTGEELDLIEKLYQQAMKLEIEFFTAQPSLQPTVAPLYKELNPTEWRLILYSDFDLTCTVIDSSAVLAEIAILRAPKSDQNSPEGQSARIPCADLKNIWLDLSRQYTEEYEQCIDNILATRKEDEFNYEALHKSLELVSDFEKKANARVIESGVLKGFNLEDVKKIGEHTKLHDGCANFFQKLVHNENLDVNVHILSYCWCGDLIRSVFSSGGLQALNIHANEILYEESISTGEIDKKVESPIEKVEAFTKNLNNCGNDKKTLSVYIGDSVGDLLCLLKADIGILVGSSESIRKLGIHFGVTFVPLFPGLVRKQKDFSDVTCFKSETPQGLLYTASTWAEIHAFILGP